MRILVIPMSAMAETAGSASRARRLVAALQKAQVEVATCAAEDMNYRPIAGVHNFPLSVPTPMGMPAITARRFFPVVQKLGITRHKTVHSFEEVLFLTGNLHGPYLKKSVEEIRAAIGGFKPNIIYSEYNLSAIIAGRLKGVRVFSSASTPTQWQYRTSPQFAKGLKTVLKAYHLPPVHSALELFDWVDKKCIPSCPELEPMVDEKAVFCGSWKKAPAPAPHKRNTILVYMGNGTIAQKKMVNLMKAAFNHRGETVYIAGQGLPTQTMGNLHLAPYFDFEALLPGAKAFINHGGQNSVVDGLINGVPQIICPGKVFERQFNAQGVCGIHGGVMIDHKTLSPRAIVDALKTIEGDPTFRLCAQAMGEKLCALGGTDTIVGECEKSFANPRKKTGVQA